MPTDQLLAFSVFKVSGNILAVVEHVKISLLHASNFRLEWFWFLEMRRVVTCESHKTLH